MPLRPSYSILKNLHFTLKIDRPTEWFLSVDAVDIWRELLRLGKSIDIFRNSRWCQRHLGFLENYYFWPKRSILVDAKCMLLKCCENCFIPKKTINFFEFQDGGRRHLGFWKICTFDSKHRCWFVLGVHCWTLVRTDSYLRKLLTFSTFKMAVVAVLDFGKFAFLTLRVGIGLCHCVLLTFGDNCFIFAETIKTFRSSRWRLWPS